ncbi:MAG: DUF1254 domain-containing protein [Thermodesulfobacteriota bacterium]
MTPAAAVEDNRGSARRCPIRTVARLSLVLAAVTLLAHASACGDRGSGAGGAQPLEELAADGFLLGYPLVVTERTLQFFGAALGVNRPFTQQARSDASSRVVVAPNTDTLYAIAVLDLRPGPLLLELPDIPDRYHTFQLLDAYTESFAYLGTRTTEGRGGVWLLAPAGWQGDVPAGATRIDVPTPQAFLLGRVLVEDDADVPNVTALTAQVALAPLDPSAPPPPALGAAPGPPAETGRTGLAFWDEMGDALAINPPTTDAQRELLARLDVLGVGPGRHPSSEVTDPALRAALEAGIARGFARIERAAEESGTVNGWRLRTDIGTYGDDLETRAAIARLGWGANVPAEAIYPTAVEDSSGEPLDGAHRYRVRFAPGELPPVNAFWSLTLYAADRFLFDNPQRRYAISDRSPDLVYGADGSLEVWVQAEPPPGLEANWLPAPAGEFSLMLRLYLPTEEVTRGSWRPPTIERMD